MSNAQLELFDVVKECYIKSNGAVKQKDLYSQVARKLNVDPVTQVAKVGGQDKVNLFYRSVRWVQQSLKQQKLLINVGRGEWELCGTERERLHAINASKSVIAMSTSLGVVICADSKKVFESGVIDEDIHLIASSVPYLNTRAYAGFSSAKEWVEFIMSVIRPILPRLADGASIALNVGQDSFLEGMPARHTHIERLILSMEDEGMYLVDRHVWSSNKAPTPTQWCSNNRYMLHAGYEFVLHWTNNPLKLRTNNQRVLIPHSDTHKKFVLSGGTKKAARNSDGAHRKSVGDYAATDLSKGKIPTNSYYFGNKCGHNERVNKYAREVLNCVTHGAKMPYRLAKFIIDYMSAPGDLVVDPFSGTGTFGQACQAGGRRFVMIEKMVEYVKQSFIRYTSLTDDIWINPLFSANG